MWSVIILLASSGKAFKSSAVILNSPFLAKFSKSKSSCILLYLSSPVFIRPVIISLYIFFLASLNFEISKDASSFNSCSVFSDSGVNFLIFSTNSASICLIFLSIPLSPFLLNSFLIF